MHSVWLECKCALALRAYSHAYKGNLGKNNAKPLITELSGSFVHRLDFHYLSLSSSTEAETQADSGKGVVSLLIPLQV